MNLFIGIIVDAMQREHAAELAAEAEAAEAASAEEQDRLEALTGEIAALRREVAELAEKRGNS